MTPRIRNPLLPKNPGALPVKRVATRTLVPGLLTLACLLAAAPATAQVNYVFISGYGAFVTTSPNASGDIVIASAYNGSPVFCIVGSAFSGCTNLTSVTIPNSVTNTLPGASAEFVDPQSTNHPHRFYRARSDHP